MHLLEGVDGVSDHRAFHPVTRLGQKSHFTGRKKQVRRSYGIVHLLKIASLSSSPQEAEVVRNSSVFFTL